MGKSKWDVKKEEVRELLQQGHTVLEISEKTEIPKGSMGFLIERWGLEHLQVRHTGNYSDKARDAWSGAYKEIHRSKKTHGKNHWSYGKLKFQGKWIPEDEVRIILKELREQDLTLANMAEECQVSRKTITNQLRRFGLQGGLRSGERTPQWKGGHDKYRGVGWLTIREQILQRDGYRCIICSKDQETAGSEGHGLSVHHKVPFCETHDNSPENLETLCQSDHMIAEWKLGRGHVQV